METAVFDLETSGVLVHSDLIVTAYVGVLSDDGTIQREKEWIVDPGIEIPTGASDVHGFTNAVLDADPRTRKDFEAVILEIAGLIWQLCGNTGLPLSGHNISFDLSMLNAHLGRQHVQPLPFGLNAILVADSLVLDKHFNRFVKGAGQRKLIPTAARYGITLTDEQAHAASFDAVASGRIVQKIIERHAKNTPIATLHEQQKKWRAEQQTDLQAWLRKGTDPEAICETGWPTYEEAAA